jgi:hypothetical protein
MDHFFICFQTFLQTLALLCGILSSCLYFIVNIIVPAKYPGYNPSTQVVSELSAIGAPTRRLWSVLVTPYTLLMIFFAWGIWKSAGENHRLRIAAGLLFVYAVLGLLWPFAPMHQREILAAGGSTFSDTMHIALGLTTETLFLLALALGAVALGKLFRVYSI